MNQAYESARDKEALIRHMVGENRSGESRLMADEDSQRKLHTRLKTATSKFMMLEIRRSQVLEDTFNSIWRREERELMRPLKVRLGEEDGEQGMDIGGVQQEFFRLAIAEALNPAYGIFYQTLSIAELTRISRRIHHRCSYKDDMVPAWIPGTSLEVSTDRYDCLAGRVQWT
jgi:hypothetical protein